MMNAMNIDKISSKTKNLLIDSYLRYKFGLHNNSRCELSTSSNYVNEMKQALAGDGLYEKLTRAFILIFIQSSLSKQVHESMKKKIAEYSAPDLSGFDKRLAVIEENSGKTSDYTRDIKNDLKNDIRRNETVTEQIERSVKQAQRESDTEMREMRKGVREDLDKARSEAAAVRTEMAQARREISAETQTLKKEVTKEVEVLKKELDQKIQKAIDNPLANK